MRPALEYDGGGIELIDFDEEKKAITVRMFGACNGCFASQATLEYGVKAAVKKFAPEITEIIAQV